MYKREKGKGGHISRQRERESKAGRGNILSVGGHTCTVYRESEIHREQEGKQFSL